MLSRRGPRARLARRIPAALLALAGSLTLTLSTAIPARADIVRQQEMWVLNAVHAPSAWSVTKGHGVTVAVIDSGVNPDVPDLSGSVHTGPDLTGVSTSSSNANWGVHGTWMASLIAGHGHGSGDGSGIMGVAPQARVLSIRVVTDQGDPGFNAYEREPASRIQRALAHAIRYATGHKAGVISMSLGYGAPSSSVRSAIAYALSKGVVVVASSGNSGGTGSAHRDRHAPYSFPADYPGVLGVGAVAKDGKPAGFSSDNLSVGVAAPGVKVPAQGRDSQYWLVSGTSPACALVAGVAALIKSRYPTLPPALADQAITATAQSRPSDGYDAEVGFGTVDAAAALTMAGHLEHDHDGGRGVATNAHFGGGPGAAPPVPVQPRGPQQLILYCLLAGVSSVLAGWAAIRLVTARLSRTRSAAHGPAHGGRW